MKQRKSIDLEFHDMLDLDDSAHYSVTSEVSRRWMTHSHQQQQQQNGGKASQVYHGESEASDGDSFGEASVNSQPDQQYLHELLDEEYHPERLNLLDDMRKQNKDDDSSSGAPRLKTKNGIKIRNYSDHDDDDVSISSVDENDNDVGSRCENSSKFGSSWNSSWWSESEPPDDVHEGFGIGESSSPSPAAAAAHHHPDEPPEQRLPRLQKVRQLQIDDDESDVQSHRPAKDELEKGETEEESLSVHDYGEGGVVVVELEDGRGDTFHDSPNNKKPSSFNSRGSARSRGRPKMLKDMQSMGKSTKKSLRTINGKSFWAQPFKGLGRSRRAAKKGTAPTMDPPESPT